MTEKAWLGVRGIKMRVKMRVRARVLGVRMRGSCLGISKDEG